MIGKCNCCGLEKEVVKHHVSYFPELITQLCKSCHRTEHCRTNNFLKKDNDLMHLAKYYMNYFILYNSLNLIVFKKLQKC